MKIAPNTMSTRANDHARSAMSRAKLAEISAASDVSSRLVESSPAKSAAPAGLVKVIARLQAIPEADRTAGQSTAADRISRNIDRYLEVQAMAPSTVANESGEIA